MKTSAKQTVRKSRRAVRQSLRQMFAAWRVFGEARLPPMSEEERITWLADMGFDRYGRPVAFTDERGAS
jgi:hypothetical protein